MNTAQKLSAQVNMIQALNWALHEAMAADPTVLIFGEEAADHGDIVHGQS
jgi:pyruvate/2-oxoglutarate/acetoin dehydrogenase E1 component